MVSEFFCGRIFWETTVVNTVQLIEKHRCTQCGIPLREHTG